jgi:hypothetical protein
MMNSICRGREAEARTRAELLLLRNYRFGLPPVLERIELQNVAAQQIVKRGSRLQHSRKHVATDN